MAANDAREQARGLLDHLERTLQSQIDEGFFADPKAFRSLPRVIEILGENLQMDQNASWTSTITVDYLQQHNVAYQNVLQQLHTVKGTITELVDNQYEDLNAGVENMGHVLNQYTSARSSVKHLRQSLTEVRGLLTKGMTQQRVRDLWMNKLLYKHTIKILDKLEMLTNAPVTISNMIEQKRFVGAVTHLNDTLAAAFSEDLVDVKGGDLAREELVLRKQLLLEEIVKELRVFVFLQGGMSSDLADMVQSQPHPSAKTVSDDRDDDSLSELDSGSIKSSDQASEMMETRSMISFGGFSATSGGTSRSLSDRLSIEAWPDNIQDVTLETELALSIPASAGNVLIRLCVRALLLLNCLDDAERMIVEDARAELATIMSNIRMQFTRAGMFQSDGVEKRYTDGVYKSSDEELRVFNSYFRALMDAYAEVLKRMFYILVLIQSARRLESDNSPDKSSRSENSPRPSILGDATKKAIAGRPGLRELRSCLEAALLTELRRHIEKELLVSGEDDGSWTPDLSRQTLDIDLGNGGDDMVQAATVDHVCPASPYLAVFVYRSVEKFITQLDRTCGTAPSRGHVDSPLLSYVQGVVADDVMPLIQRDANVSMRTVSHDDEAFLPGSASSSYTSSRGSRSKRIAPNQAADICFKTVHELFRYALLVPQHTDQVVLILQRAVEEFATAVRNRRREQTSRLASQEVCSRIQSNSSVSAVLSSDVYHRRYCKRVFDGKPSALEVLGVSNQIRAAAQEMFPEHDAESDEEDERPSLAPGRQSLSASPSLRAALASRRPNFPPSVWALDAQPYVITRDRVSLDYKQIGCLASLIYSCDWLAYQLCKACLATQRKTQPGGQRMSVQRNRTTSMFQRTGALWLTVTQCCGQLEKLSNEGIVHMRSELELSSFYFVQQFPQKRFDLNARHSDAGRGTEPEPSVAALNAHLSTCQECICAAAPAELFVTVVHNTCSTLPSLMLYAMSFIKGQVSSDGSSRLARSAMSIQQTLIGALETAITDKQQVAELVQDLNDQFGRLRRFMGLADLSVEDLKLYIQRNNPEFERDELLVLWRLACRKLEADTANRNVDEEFANLFRK